MDWSLMLWCYLAFGMLYVITTGSAVFWETLGSLLGLAFIVLTFPIWLGRQIGNWLDR